MMAEQGSQKKYRPGKMTGNTVPRQVFMSPADDQALREIAAASNTNVAELIRRELKRVIAAHRSSVDGEAA
jgi:hypothetical protein